MSGFEVDDVVLVPGRVIGIDSEGYRLVRFVGAELEFAPRELGRELTAQDVRLAVRGGTGTVLAPEAVADYLNRVVKGGK